MVKTVKENVLGKENIEKCIKKLNPNAPLFPAKVDLSKGEEIYMSLKGMIEQQAAPGIEIKTFDGNPLEYHHFVDLFREVVEKWIQDIKGRLLRLLKYTKGETQYLIKQSPGAILH